MAPPPQSKTLTLTIRATNGAELQTEQFHPNQKVALVARKAVAHFVDAGAMADGDYAVALLDAGGPRVLSDAESLEDAGVRDDAILVLVAREPQVDGSCTRA